MALDTRAWHAWRRRVLRRVAVPPRFRFPNQSDEYKPPVEPHRVRCGRCGRVYVSSLVKWRAGLWACPTPGCDGAGWGADIWPHYDQADQGEASSVF